METLKQTITEKKTRNGEGKTQDILKEKKFWITKFSWPAIFAGVVVATVSQMLLSILGIGIGLATINPLREQDPLEGLGVGSIIWWSATMLFSLFLGGWTTGKMYSGKFTGERSMHGLLTWCTFTIFSFFMLTTSLGKLISGAGNVIGTALTTGASIAENQIDISSLTNDARTLFLLQSGSFDNNPARENIRTTQPESTTMETAGPISNPYNNQLFLSDVESFLRSDNTRTTEMREALVNSLMNQTGMGRSEANSKVDNWISSYENLKEEAKVKAEKTANITSIAAIIFFFSLLIGALVTIWGTRVAPSTVEYRESSN